MLPSTTPFKVRFRVEYLWTDRGHPSRSIYYEEDTLDAAMIRYAERPVDFFETWRVVRVTYRNWQEVDKQILREDGEEWSAVYEK